MGSEDFFTFREYMKREYDMLTASMEDYLEMIYRLSKESGFTRIHELASALNVQPPSATRMAQKLAEVNLIKYEKYGIVIMTDEGRTMGKALLERHNIIESFLKLIGISQGVLEETEKIEHTLSAMTLDYLNDFVNFMRENPKIIVEFENYRKSKETNI